MINFVKSLFIDMRNRIDKMKTYLELLSVVSPVSSEFKNKTVEALIALKSEIDGTITSGILNVDIFLRNNLIKYNSIHNTFLEIELFRFLPIIKYGQAEEYFEKLIYKIYAEIQCLQSVPFISTISNSESYYWAYPKYNMIALPNGEEKNLLNLSDLYHEIGHLLFQQSKQFLIGNHFVNISQHFKDEKQRLRDEGNPDSFINEIEKGETFWVDTWTEEFTCDLIATYLVGPAYAWTNMKLCTISSSYNAIYSDGNMFREHPPDEARMRVIFKMLESTGFNAELAEIESTWNKFLIKTQNSKPHHYQFIFPNIMIDSITQNVLTGCNNIGLQRYSEQVKNLAQPVSLSINEAWSNIRNAPDSFGLWESSTLDTLIK